MESSKHGHKRKHVHHQNSRRSEKPTSCSTQELAPVFGKLIERDSELQKYAQNVLGRYSDYQSAVKKMDVTDQMYGVSELAPSSKPPLSRGEGGSSSSKSSHSTGGTSLPPDQRKDKVKKNKKQQQQQSSNPKLMRSIVKMHHSVSESGDVTATKKKVSVRPYITVPSESLKEEKSAVSTTPFITHSNVSWSTDATSGTATSLSTHSASHSLTEQASSTSPTGAVKEKKMKKAKRKKNGSGNDARNSFMQTSKPIHPHKSTSQDQSGWREPPDAPAPLPTKPRPGALKFSGDDSNSQISVQSDVPDTGDVQHMLHELLNPLHVSVVTPIPTPSKGHPFIFPSHGSTKPVFKTPNSSDISHSSPSTGGYHNFIASTDLESTIQHKESGTSSIAHGKSTEMKLSYIGHVSRSSSSSSDSSSDSSSSSGSSDSSSSADDYISREHIPVELEDDLFDVGRKGNAQVIEDKDEGTRFTLEMLQKEMASNTVAITPLKNTPPHLMCASEDLANLSPAKPFKVMGVTRRDLTMTNLASHSSQGFHPLYTQSSCSSEASNSDSDNNSADSSSDSESDTSPAGARHFHSISQEVSGEGGRLSNTGSQYPTATMALATQYSAPIQTAATSENADSHRNKRQTSQQDIAVPKKYSKHSPLSDTIREPSTAGYSPPASGRRPLQGSSRGGLLHNKLSATPQASIRGDFQRVASTAGTETSCLLVSIPLADLRVPDSTQQQLSKPKATVEPYNVRTTASNKTPHRRNTADGLPEVDEVQGRDHYSRLQDDEYSTVHDYGSRERSRVQWEREHRNYGSNSRASGRASDFGRSHGWEREFYHGAGGEEYWSDPYENTRVDSQRGGGRSYLRGGRKSDPDYFMQEAKRRKKDADKIMVPGLEKAKLYMVSVTYFMRHGGAIEHEQETGPNHQAVKRNPYKMYSDTLNMIKYCKNMAGECKPLLVLCLRCQSALYWRMYLIKQPSTALAHKELQEFFIPPKGSQSKSPFGVGLSPLCSPASVGSTASTSSGGGTGAGTSHSLLDPTSSSLPIPRHIFNKAADHLTVSALINTCLELWRLSDSYMEQCREFFLNADRKAGLTIHYYSPIFQVALWVEDILKSF